MLQLFLALVGLVKLLHVAAHGLLKHHLGLIKSIDLVLKLAILGFLARQVVTEEFLLLLRLGEQFDLLADLVLELLLLVQDLLHGVVLGEAETRTTLHDLVQVSDLLLQISNDLPRVFFLLLGLFDQFPGLVNLTFEHRDGTGVFLGQLDGGLHTHRIVRDRLVHVLAALEQPLLVLVRGA